MVKKNVMNEETHSTHTQTNLTSQRTETECVQEAPPTYLTYVRNRLPTFRLRPLVYKQNPSAVYYIRLHPAYV